MLYTSKILVTGATSGLGRTLTTKLHHEKIKTYAIGRDTTQLNSLKKQGISTYNIDLTTISQNNYNNSLINDLLKNSDQVWHCAALSSPWGDYQDFLNINTYSTCELFKRASRAGVKKFIYISTPAIYYSGKPQYNIVETDIPEKQINHYATTKRMAEIELQQLAYSSDTELVILRPRAIFGEYDNVLLPRMLKMYSVKNNQLTLPNGGNVLLDLTWADNVYEAMRCASKPSINGIFNITNQEPILLKDALKLLFQELNLKLNIKSINPTLLNHLASAAELCGNIVNKEPIFTKYSIGAISYDMTLSNDSAINILGYMPRTSTKKSLQITARQLLANGSISRWLS